MQPASYDANYGGLTNYEEYTADMFFDGKTPRYSGAQTTVDDNNYGPGPMSREDSAYASAPRSISPENKLLGLAADMVPQESSGSAAAPDYTNNQQGYTYQAPNNVDFSGLTSENLHLYPEFSRNFDDQNGSMYTSSLSEALKYEVLKLHSHERYANRYFRFLYSTTSRRISVN